jgi:hypothetical protein
MEGPFGLCEGSGGEDKGCSGELNVWMDASHKVLDCDYVNNPSRRTKKKASR